MISFNDDYKNRGNIGNVRNFSRTKYVVVFVLDLWQSLPINNRKVTFNWSSLIISIDSHSTFFFNSSIFSFFFGPWNYIVIINFALEKEYGDYVWLPFPIQVPYLSSLTFSIFFVWMQRRDRIPKSYTNCSISTDRIRRVERINCWK